MNRNFFSMPAKSTFSTASGLVVRRHVELTDIAARMDQLVGDLDHHPGVLLSSGMQVPGRYDNFDLGFSSPPLVVSSRGRDFAIEALNPRGEILVAFLADALKRAADPMIVIEETSARRIAGSVPASDAPVEEENRTRRPTIFSLMRQLIAALKIADDGLLGFYGAFSYDLVFQLEDLEMKMARADDQRDVVVYLPDQLFAYDRRGERGLVATYEFSWMGRSTEGLPRQTKESAYKTQGGKAFRDMKAGHYREIVEEARQHFARGDLFEAVPGQLFGEPCTRTPAEIFRRLARINPAPFGALINLGEGEFLVSASPEMFVRSDGERIETCPISGTIRRGKDAIADAEQIRLLLNSEKDAFELNMCTDVDRNDKARICEPGSIKVIARRQVETYSKLFHTVDHVEAVLRPEFDALDAFLSHAWAVTVTGAPKLWAMQFVEDHEGSPRRWYGGALGVLGLDGHINTGITIRTVRMKDGTAEVRVGATLLYDSDPVAEEEECQTKAEALHQALRGSDSDLEAQIDDQPSAGAGKKVLLVDHDDSFVHMLADYFRQTGATVNVVRHTHARERLVTGDYDLLVMSPGPGKPSDFNTKETIGLALERNLPVFGVCLGQQAIGEYFGGKLSQLATPSHGRPSRIAIRGGSIFSGLPVEIAVGRYHSLYIDPDSMPEDLFVSATTDDGVPMAVEHRELPIAAVQFHPESLMTLEGGAGNRIVENAMRLTERVRG
ncbi:MAG: anthranilate synthase component I [Rhodobiaceae bacterium]|nr:anthranilate synthase component I [Rhodobiaceae bacterium]MCC0057151.1 anthranilate synthase component I [Rhodobiaceae bacterium]